MPTKLKDDVADVLEIAEGAIEFTLGCIILIGGLLLGFFPGAHSTAALRSR